jgi:hypothetical protein
VGIAKLTPGVVKLGSEPDLTPWNAGIFDTTANLCFIAIGKGSVNMTIAPTKRNLDCLLNLIGSRLPSPEANCWDLIPSIKSESLPVTGVLSAL